MAPQAGEAAQLEDEMPHPDPCGDDPAKEQTLWRKPWRTAAMFLSLAIRICHPEQQGSIQQSMALPVNSSLEPTCT